MICSGSPGWSLDGFCSLSALPMFHISAMTSLVSWSLKGLAVNLCNDLKYFYRQPGRHAQRCDGGGTRAAQEHL